MFTYLCRLLCKRRTEERGPSRPRELGRSILGHSHPFYGVDGVCLKSSIFAFNSWGPSEGTHRPLEPVRMVVKSSSAAGLSRVSRYIFLIKSLLDATSLVGVSFDFTLACAVAHQGTFSTLQSLSLRRDVRRCRRVLRVSFHLRSPKFKSVWALCCSYPRVPAVHRPHRPDSST